MAYMFLFTSQVKLFRKHENSVYGIYNPYVPVHFVRMDYI